MRTRTGAILLLLVVASGCENDTTTPAPSAHVPVARTTTPSTTPSPSARPTAARPSPRRHVEPPCDPGAGNPRPKKGCPDPDPVSGWLRIHGAALPTLRLFRTIVDNEEGRAYARAHHLGDPFFDGFFDAPTGERRPLALAPGTVCTGITIDPGPQFGDHTIPCADLLEAARTVTVRVAVWRSGGRVVQASELFRP